MGLIRSVRRGLTWVTLGAAGGAAVVTVRHLLQTPQPLESGLPGEARIDRKHGGDIFYNVAGPADAAPLVLLHDFYPGASNFEFRGLFPRLARSARVYAPDWLGFGMSEHPHVAYTGEFYAGVLEGFLRDVVAQRATVLAHGLAGNIAVRAAEEAPDLVERLILVSPEALAGEVPEPTLGQTIVRASQRASLGLVPYALLSTRPALRWIANSRSRAAGADEEQVDHLFASAHQFGGQHALLALLTGELDLPIRNVLPVLQPPVLIIVGELDPKRPRDAMEDLAVLSPHADLDVIPGAGSAVFQDQPEAVADAVTRWLGLPAPRGGAQPSLQPASTYLNQGAASSAPSVGPASPPANATAAPEDEDEDEDEDEAIYQSPLLPPMDDMGSPVPDIPPTDYETERVSDERTAAAYTPADMGAGEVEGLARLAGTTPANASAASGPFRTTVPPATDVGDHSLTERRATGTTGATEDQVSRAAAGMTAPASVGATDAGSAGENLPPLDTPATATQVAGAEQGAAAATGEEVTGGAGYVTPGVSDMGLEGPNAETVGTGLSATETVPTASSTPTDTAAAGAGRAAPSADSPTELLPEAGDVAPPSDEAEREARAGVSPPVSEGANIADTVLAGSPLGADEGAGEYPDGKARGKTAAAEPETPAWRDDEVPAAQPRSARASRRVETTDTAVDTTDTSVATPAEAVATQDTAVATPADAVGPTAAGEEEEAQGQPTRPMRAVRPRAGQQPDVVPGSEEPPQAQPGPAASRIAGDKARTKTDTAATAPVSASRAAEDARERPQTSTRSAPEQRVRARSVRESATGGKGAAAPASGSASASAPGQGGPHGTHHKRAAGKGSKGGGKGQRGVSRKK